MVFTGPSLGGRAAEPRAGPLTVPAWPGSRWLYERNFLGLELLWIAAAAGYIGMKWAPASQPG